jgi:diguanylate cyclase (GGDEF)-like protein
MCANELDLLAGHTEDEACKVHRLENELTSARRDLRRAQHDLMASEVRGLDARHTALHDPLTGLPNRHSFEEISTEVLAGHAARARAFGLLYIDLDGFKAINDTHGHSIGDELLKVIGSRLKRAVRSEDSVCRHGGDEFVCLLLDIKGNDQVATIAEKLFAAVAAPCQLGSLAVSVTPSIGIALYPGDGIAVDELLRSADSAMFGAKLHGLRHLFFNGSAVHRQLEHPFRRW